MIELTFVLLLFMNGEAIEYTPYDSLSQCLSTRRKIQRNVGTHYDFDKRWVCKEMKVRLSQGSDGKLFIEEIIE